jgi:hypothetical protein
LASTRPVLVCIPSSDRRFIQDVRAAAASVDTLTPSTLAGALRSSYPDVLIRRSELSGSVLETWYVYRERSFPA